MAEGLGIVGIGERGELGHQASSGWTKADTLCSTILRIADHRHQILGCQAVDELRDGAASESQVRRQFAGLGSIGSEEGAHDHPFGDGDPMLLHPVLESVRHVVRHGAQPITKMRLKSADAIGGSES